VECSAESIVDGSGELGDRNEDKTQTRLLDFSHQDSAMKSHDEEQEQDDETQTADPEESKSTEFKPQYHFQPPSKEVQALFTHPVFTSMKNDAVMKNVLEKEPHLLPIDSEENKDLIEKLTRTITNSTYITCPLDPNF
jgi:hypothetical protein